MRGAAAALAAVLIAGTATGADALVKSGANIAGPGLNSRLKAVSGTGPGAVVPFTAFWGMRAYTAAQATGTTNALRLRRASDNGELDIKILATGELDTASATTHCAATSCFVSAVYDQIGNNACGGLSCDLVQPSTVAQPAFIFSCLGARPCVHGTIAAHLLSSANNFTPATGAMSVHYVGGRLVGTAVTSAISLGAGATRINETAGAATWAVFSSAGNVVRAASDGAWHVAAAVVAAGANASSMSVDGVTTAGTITPFAAAGLPSAFRGGSTVTQGTMEAGFIDNAALSQAQIEALNTDARTAYGLP